MSEQGRTEPATTKVTRAEYDDLKMLAIARGVSRARLIYNALQPLFDEATKLKKDLREHAA